MSKIYKSRNRIYGLDCALATNAHYIYKSRNRIYGLDAVAPRAARRSTKVEIEYMD